MTTLVKGFRAACYTGSKECRFLTHAARSLTKKLVNLNDALVFEGKVKDLYKQRKLSTAKQLIKIAPP